MGIGERRVLFVAPPLAKDLPKDAKPGTTLIGTITYGKTTTGGQSPASFPLVLLVPPAEDVKEKPKEDEAVAADTEWTEQLAEAVRDAKVRFLKELKVRILAVRPPRASVLP